MLSVAVIDVETTGMGDHDKVVEFASVPIENIEGWVANHRRASRSFVQPKMSIPYEARAVHHISDEMVDGAPYLSTAMNEVFAENGFDEIDYIAAHNAKFDRKFIDPEMNNRSPEWICTYKVGLTLYPDCANHKNATLFHYLGLGGSPDMDRFLSENTLHRALPDAFLTAHVLCEMAKHKTFEEMATITANPILLDKITFGKHKGTPFSEIDEGYLRWMQGQDFNEDIQHTINHHLNG